MVKTICRAKDPATCWRHGDPTAKALNNLFDPAAAKKAIRHAVEEEQKAFENNDAESFLEARHNVVGAQDVYDSTFDGLSELDKSIGEVDRLRNLSYTDRQREKTALEARRDAAVMRREMLLNKDVNYLFSERTIAHIREQYGVRTVTPEDIMKGDLREFNLSVPLGTPFLVETTNGWFIDTASNGMRDEYVPASKFEEFWKGTPQFARYDKNYATSVEFSWRSADYTNASGSHYVRLTQLDPKIFTDNAEGLDAFVPPVREEADKVYGDFILTGRESHNLKYGRYSIRGEKFLYVMEGSVTYRSDDLQNLQLVLGGGAARQWIRREDIKSIEALPSKVMEGL